MQRTSREASPEYQGVPSLYFTVSNRSLKVTTVSVARLFWRPRKFLVVGVDLCLGV